MIAPTRRSHPDARIDLALEPGIKIWLRLNGTFFMGPRYVALLSAIDRLGSIRAACAEVGLSYRTCLNRIRQMERVLGQPVLDTRRGGAEGGGACLTPTSRVLVRVYADWRAELLTLSDAAFARALARAPELAAALGRRPTTNAAPTTPGRGRRPRLVKGSGGTRSR